MSSVTQLTVRGQPGSSALVRREDLFSYSLQVQWAEERRWRETQVVLPDGRPVAIDQYVGDNFRRPRQFHPEYALAVELLIANAVFEAKERGFRVSAIELGMWPYLTLTTMGKRVTKIGLAEPQVGLDGRTLSRTGYQWIDHDNEGVMLVPWANGDQLIRIRDDKGRYVIPVDERTGDATKFMAQSWRKVQRYEQLGYASELEWCDVPLLEAGDDMVEQHECQHCLFFFPVGTLGKDNRSRKRVCLPCKSEIEQQRSNAYHQGWDYDKKRPLPKVSVKQVREIQIRGVVFDCAAGKHFWGMQMRGTSNGALSEEAIARGEGMRITRECILCEEPLPKELWKKKKDPN